jgi:conjugal transfer mating pair stabilization protein TraG
VEGFSDQRAYEMMQSGAQRHFERNGYDAKDAALKASTLIGQASADPTFAKITANAFDQEQMLRNDLTAAQTQVGAMEGRRDYAGDRVTAVERGNVATEQAHRTGGNQGQRQAAAMLGLLSPRQAGASASSMPCRARRDRRRSASFPLDRAQ